MYFWGMLIGAALFISACCCVAALANRIGGNGNGETGLNKARPGRAKAMTSGEWRDYVVRIDIAVSGSGDKEEPYTGPEELARFDSPEEAQAYVAAMLEAEANVQRVEREQQERLWLASATHHATDKHGKAAPQPHPALHGAGPKAKQGGQARKEANHDTRTDT